MEENEELEVVYLQVDNWYTPKDEYCAEFLSKLEKGELDEEINYSEVWYDMAIIYCVTTTKEYVEEHHLEAAVENLEVHSTFKNYYPQYNPEKFGCGYCGEYKEWAPYKEFDRQVWEAWKNKENKEGEK